MGGRGGGGGGGQLLAPMATGGEKKNQLNEDKQEASELPPTPLKRQEARAPVFREPSAREVCRLAER